MTKYSPDKSFPVDLDGRVTTWVLLVPSWTDSLKEQLNLSVKFGSVWWVCFPTEGKTPQMNLNYLAF